MQMLMEAVMQVRSFRQSNPHNLAEAHARAEQVIHKLAAMAGMDDDVDDEGDDSDGM